MNTEVQKLISSKNFSSALELLDKQSLDNQLEIDKNICNKSLIHYLMQQYDLARNIILKRLDINNEIYPRLYYRLAKAYEGLQEYELMCSAYNEMLKLLPEAEKDKKYSHMQDYYNKDIHFMKQWIINSGGTISNVLIEYYDVDYRGMKLSAPIKPTQYIIQIPWSCVISLNESTRNNPYVKKIIESGVKINSTHSHVAMELIYIKQTPENPKNNYIRCFPKYFDNVPINFTIEELLKLEGSYSIVKILQKLFILKLEYDNINNILNGAFTFEEFVWARTAVITRVYAIKKNGESDTILAPFADMANHETPPNTKWEFNDKLQMFTVESEQYLKSGDILYETYGFKCNYRYFVNYGFTVPNNQNEEVSIIFNYLYQEKIKNYIDKILEHPNKNKTVRQLFEEELFEATDKEILHFLLTETMVYQIGYTYNDTVKKMFIDFRRNTEMTRETELLIHQIILRLSTDMLNKFITTYDDDQKLLTEYDYNFNLRNAIIMRISEKLVLEFWINLSSTLIDILLLPKIENKSFKKLNKKMGKYNGFKTFSPYLAQLTQLK
jgi:histone-lysine N-methyltransferase SETD3